MRPTSSRAGGGGLRRRLAGGRLAGEALEARCVVDATGGRRLLPGGVSDAGD
ncbi:hypothetical protein WME91_06315 [Sorangium sp. So ce269]